MKLWELRRLSQLSDRCFRKWEGLLEISAALFFTLKLMQFRHGCRQEAVPELHQSHSGECVQTPEEVEESDPGTIQVHPKKKRFKLKILNKNTFRPKEETCVFCSVLNMTT